MFDKYCRRIDYRLAYKGDGDEELEEVMTKLFFTEDKIFSFQESLANCTDIFYFQLSQLEDDDEDGRNTLQDTYIDHRNKVENTIGKLVKFWIYFCL